MTTYYVDSGAASGGDGSILSPWKTLSAISVTDGDTILLKRGSYFTEQLLAANIAANNLTIDAYGEGNLPIISGAQTVTAWNFISDSIAGWNAGSNVCGNVAEDGKPLIFKAWNTNLTTTSLVPGSYTFDYNTFNLYVYPTTGTVYEHNYKASVRLYCASIGGAYSGITVKNLRFEQASRHGVINALRTNWAIQECEFWLVGGYRDPSVHLGNGIETSYLTVGGICSNNVFEYIFDSAVTTQLFEVSPASTGSHVYENNIIKYCGLAGIEISAHTANQNIDAIAIKKNNITELGPYGWLQFRSTNSYGIGVVNNGGSTVRLAGISIENNYIETRKRGIINNSATVAGIGVVARGNVIKGPGFSAYTDTTINGVRMVGGTIKLISNVITGFTYGINTAGSATFLVEVFNNVITDCSRGTFRDNTNSTFNYKNNIFVRLALIHTGNFSGGVTGNNNCLWQNTATGINYSSTGDILVDPLLTPEYKLSNNSPCRGTGNFAGWLRDAEGKAFYNPPSIGAYEYERPRISRN